MSLGIDMFEAQMIHFIISISLSNQDDKWTGMATQALEEHNDWVFRPLRIEGLGHISR